MPSLPADTAQGPASKAGAAAFVRQLLAHPRSNDAVLVVWALLALIATQIPQADAPAAVADGLSRSDLLLLQNVGLDRLGASVLAWLAVALTLVVGLARALFPQDATQWTGVARAAIDPAQTVAQALSSALPGAQPRWRRSHRDAALTIGHPAWGRLALSLSGGAAIAYVLLASQVALPVLLDVPLGAAGATASAWTAEGGALAPAPGHWEANCTRSPGGAECKVQGGGSPAQVHLSAGSSALVGPHRYTWIATGRAADMPSLTLRWQRDPKPALPLTVQLTPGVPADSASLHLSLRPAVHADTGPLVMAASDRDGVTDARVLASPALVPKGRLAATATGGEVLRIEVADPKPFWLLWLSLLLAGIGAVLAWALPAVHLTCAEGVGAAWTVHSCNRPAFLAALQQAIARGSSLPRGEAP